MHIHRRVMVAATSAVILALPATAVAQGDTGRKAAIEQAGRWHLSRTHLPISVDRMRGVKLDSHRSLWLGQASDSPADNRRTFIYDIRTRKFQEAAPFPAAKNATDQPGDTAGLVSFSAVGVLADGSVVIAGGGVTDDPAHNAANVLSYRYYPRQNRWVRTGDLPEPQEWIGDAAMRLPDGRLLAAGGRGLEVHGSAVLSDRAFVYDPRRRTSVAEIDPATGRHTGRTITVQGAWDYTRTHDGRESTMSEPHYYGNEVRLHDGRILVTGGHTVLKNPGDGTSVLATHTDFFDPTTGAWTQGPPLPFISGEDDQISNSHGGRARGACVATLTNGKVLIAGGNTQSDGSEFFDTAVGRQSIVVLTPAADARKSHYEISSALIPAGTNSGGLLGGPGRNQLLCYAISGGRALIGGGQTDLGEDLYDTYVFDSASSTVRRGPNLVHGVAKWAAAFPDFGYPADYQCATISSREVATANSLLVFPHDVLVSGGGYNAVGGPTDPVGSTYVEQLNGL